MQKTDAVYIREELITITHPLSDAEKIECANEMSNALREKARLEGELKDQQDFYKPLIKSVEKQADTASKLYAEGSEQREILCDLIADFNTLEMVWTDVNPPHNIVSRRPMTEEEKHMQMPLINKDTAYTVVDVDDDSADSDEDEPLALPEGRLELPETASPIILEGAETEVETTA